MAGFSKRAIKGLCRLGDIIVPGDEEFPIYSKVAGTHKLNDMVQYAPDEDIELLGFLLTILSFMPGFVLRWLIKSMGAATRESKSGIIPATFRQLDLGIRGLVFSTYYTELTNPDYKGKTPFEIMGYEINRVVD